MGLADSFRKLLIGASWARLLKFFLLLLVFFIVIIRLGFKSPVSYFVFMVVAIPFIIMGILTYISTKRASSVSLEARPLPHLSEKNASASSGEKVLLSVFCVLKKFRSGYEFFDIGKASNPENAILFTESRAIFFAVPVEGEGVLMGDVDFSMMNTFFNKKHIRELGEKMVSTMSPEQILKHNPVNFAINYSDIERFKVNTFWNRGIRINTRYGKTYSYGTQSKEDLLKIRDTLKRYLYSKLI